MEAGQVPPSPDYQYYDLKDALGSDKKSFINFQKLFVADLFILDFAVFNPDGTVQLKINQPDPLIALTEGWTHRLKTAKCRIFPKNKSPLNPSLGMGKQALKLAGTLSEGCLKYPLRRFGRLQSGTATAILAAWATFQTRAAFDHDFAKIKSPAAPE